jgi:hypothetical protein
MRYLNKIIFIHSARIQYAEINLDGNVHFIGTQGVGKSTLLRAVLFFYNADSVGLGIPREKKSYADYYFPYANSYIVYEVVRDEGRFCVVTYKSQNRVCFRLLDGAFKQEYFVDVNGNVPEQWEQIAQRLDAKRVTYVRRKIDNYGEYRDILYGNQAGKQGEFKRYALMESKEYANIPKTIQNVFLNSKMEADFIKQTIIASLENDIHILLDKYNHHLKDFDVQLADIRRFNEPKTREQGESILHLLRVVQNLEREKVAFAHTLGHAFSRAQAQRMPLTEALEEKEQALEAGKARWARLREAHQKEEAKTNSEIAVLNAKLKEARELARKYEAMDMPQLVARVNRKPSLENERMRLQAEKEGLLQQQQALSQAFGVRLTQLENQQQGYKNSLQKEALDLDASLLQFREALAARTEKLIDEVRKHQKDALDHARELHALRSQEKARLEHEKTLLQKQNFFEAEIYAERETLRELTAAQGKEQAAIADAKRELERKESEHRLSEEALKRTFDDQANALGHKITEALAEADAIDRKLADQESALYGWLSREVPGWEATIGKVIDQQNILFNTELSPEHLPEQQGLYGISLDLSQVEPTVKTVAQYEQVSARLKQDAEALKKQAQDEQKNYLLKKENLQKKVNGAIKEIKATIQTHEYRLEQNARAQDESRLRMDGLLRDAVAAKAKALADAEEHLRQAQIAREEAQAAVHELEQESDKKIRSLQRDRDKEVQAEEAHIRTCKAEIAKKIEDQAALFNTRKKAIEAEQQQELAAQGVDVKRLTQLDEAINAAGAELDFIDKNRETVAVYRQHKTELLDRIEEFRIQKQGLENQIAQANERQQRSLDKVKVELEVLQAQIQQLTQQLEDVRADLQAMEEFAATDLYVGLVAHIQHPSEGHTAAFSVRQSINKLKDIHYDRLRKQIETLTRTVVDFLGKFSDKNLFNFKKQLSDEAAYMDFAAMLTDFIGEKKIERFEKEVNERFAFIIATIGRETTDMMAETGKIQGVVRKVNDDFVAKNFVGAIKRIELRVEESKNEIVQLLQRIKKFNDENAFQLGTSNLFTTDNQEKKNQEAVDLLKQFLKLTTARGANPGNITLADSFDLKFRIEENDNDTGWVEKLANVGSEGTDVLVKAMLNIMLLNVFKEGASRRFKDFKLHCMMDEIGKLHPNNVRGILKFGNERNILLINGSPIENDALAFKYIYKLHKDAQSTTRVSRIISQDIPV